MREYKFRGKDINGNWHYGLLTHDETPSFKSDYKWFISNSKGKPYAYGVIEKTIGQYTGLKDKNGKDIYEGDVVLNHETNVAGEVFTNLTLGGYEYWIKGNDEKGTPYYHCPLSSLHSTLFKVIGNIHDEVIK